MGLSLLIAPIGNTCRFQTLLQTSAHHVRRSENPRRSEGLGRLPRRPQLHEGFVPSQADTQVFDALGSAPKDAHALRWYNHIKSFGAGMKQFAKASAGFSLGGAAAAAADDDDDDVDLFGSDSEDEEAAAEKARITEERLKAYHEKKAKKPQVIAKTSVLLDVKPWDDETDHSKMLEAVKSIEMDGLVWGASKLIPIGYGIKKLQVMCTVEDEKVSVDELSEKIEGFEDYVQSVDVSAMNKI